MTAFEQGYDAFLKGKEFNPFDKDDAPFSRKEWERGWQKSKREHSK